eukprot:8696166-Alexandrium_andersonii.AAC.1
MELASVKARAMFFTACSAVAGCEASALTSTGLGRSLGGAGGGRVSALAGPGRRSGLLASPSGSGVRGRHIE